MLRPVAALLVLGGCQIVLGLDEVPDPGPPPIEVEGSFVVREVMNDEAFGPRVVEHLAPASELLFEAILDDGTETPVTYDEATGTFAFALEHEGQAYRLKYRAYDLDSELQHDARSLSLGYTAAGHLDRRPIAMVTVQASYASAQMVPAQFVSTGLYTQTSLPTYMTPISAFDWRLATPANAGVVGLLDEDQHDMLYALEFETAPLLPNVPAYSRIHAVSSKPVTQIAGTTVELTTPVPTAPNSCVHITTTNAVDAVRISSAQPRTYTASYANWIVHAVPSPELSGLAGALYVAVSGFAPQDLDVSAPLLNPFPGTTVVASTAVAQEFDVQVAGAASTKQYNTSTVYDLVAADCAAPTALSSTVGLAFDAELAGEALDFDGASLTITRGAPLLLSWQLVDEKPVDYTLVQLFELTVVAGKTSFIPRWGASVAHASAMIDPALLETDHTYVFALFTARGRPGFGTGDLRTVTFPIENATMWSHSFVAR